jgi:hypothetical protein
MVAAPCSASYNWTQIKCVVLVALLLLSQRSSQLLFSYGSGKTTRKFLADGRTDVRTLIKLNICWVKVH